MISFSPPSNVVSSIFLVFLLVTSLGFVASPVAADSHEDWEEPEGGIICGNSDGAERAQDILRAIIGIFMIMGLMFAILMYAADKFEETLGDGVLGDLDGIEPAKKAITLIVLVYFVDLISEPLFGFNISCIIPQLF